MSAVQRLRQSKLGMRLVRYAAGSVVAFVVSETTFVALFAPHILGAKGSSVAASLAGVIPGYYLNRNWAWGRRGRSHPWREVAPYWATVVIGTVAAALVTGAVNAAAAGLSRDLRTAINASAYLATYAALFVAKFAIFNYWLFADSPAGTARDPSPAGTDRPRGDGRDEAAERSRNQVPTITRA